MKIKRQTLKKTAMKTTKLFSVLSLSLILLTVTSAFSGNPLTTKGSGSTIPTIRYEVNVHQGGDNTLFNIDYWIMVTDENGRPVATVQDYVPGSSKYVFHEAAPARGNLRIARMVMVPYVTGPSHEGQLFIAPDIEKGPFIAGQTYSFDLYPASGPSKE
jgi:hypothetical protein